MKKIILASFLWGLFFNITAQKPAEKMFTKTPELHDDIVVFPITLVNAFPFISGEVNGIKGKFMFDTGNQNALEINENMVKLPQKKANGRGKVGSGQQFSVNINDTIAEVKLSNGYTYHNLIRIKSGNFDFLQNHITPDCIGYIGHDFFKGYLVKLDYLRRRITFYKNTEERKLSKDFLKGEKILGIINFETRKLPNHPLVRVKIGDVEMIGAFDTGQYGSLQLDDKAQKSLTAKSLVVSAGKDAYDNDLLTVNNIILDGTFKTNLKGVDIETLEGAAHVRKELQITEASMLDIGYRFLDQYTTVWDYEGKKIYILEK